MRDLIRHIIKEEISKLVNLIRQYYSIEGDGAYYRGDNKIQTLVSFFPEDYDNEMTHTVATSTCNWEFDDDYNLIFKFMTLPSHMFIPLLGYIGDTEELEDYLEEMHRTEAEKFMRRFNRKKDKPLNEDVDKNKRFLTKLLGEDLIDSIQKITSTKQLPKELLKHFGASTFVQQHYIDSSRHIYYFVLDGKPFLCVDMGDYEFYYDDKGFARDIPKRLSLYDMGLRFSDVVDTIFNEEEI